MFRSSLVIVVFYLININYSYENNYLKKTPTRINTEVSMIDILPRTVYGGVPSEVPVAEYRNERVFRDAFRIGKTVCD
jgi:hypothetical protein